MADYLFLIPLFPMIGFLINGLLLGRLPRTTDHATWDGWRFEIVDMDGRRIDKVLAKRETPQAKSNSEDS